MYRHAIVLLLGVAGCSSTPRGLEWYVQFTDPAAESSVDEVVGLIRRGGCESDDVVYEEPADDAAAAPPVLSTGIYGFEARAFDACCREVAASCANVELPGPEVVTTVIMLDAPPAACTPAESRCSCDGGVCVDAGVLDAAGLDAAPDTAFDAQPPDTSVVDSAPVETGMDCGATCCTGYSVGVEGDVSYCISEVRGPAPFDAAEADCLDEGATLATTRFFDSRPCGTYWQPDGRVACWTGGAGGGLVAACRDGSVVTTMCLADCMSAATSCTEQYYFCRGIPVP
jgi:hypothetical protein